MTDAIDTDTDATATTTTTDKVDDEPQDMSQSNKPPISDEDNTAANNHEGEDQDATREKQKRSVSTMMGDDDGGTVEEPEEEEEEDEVSVHLNEGAEEEGGTDGDADNSKPATEKEPQPQQPPQKKHKKTSEEQAETQTINNTATATATQAQPPQQQQQPGTPMNTQTNAQMPMMNMQQAAQMNIRMNMNMQQIMAMNNMNNPMAMNMMMNMNIGMNMNNPMNMNMAMMMNNPMATAGLPIPFKIPNNAMNNNNNNNNSPMISLLEHGRLLAAEQRNHARELQELELQSKLEQYRLLQQEKEKRVQLLKATQEKAHKQVAKLQERLTAEKKHHALTKQQLKRAKDNSTFNRNTKLVHPPKESTDTTSSTTPQPDPELMNKHDIKWQNHYRHLQQFHAKYGHAHVPALSKRHEGEEFPGLSNFVRIQRHNYIQFKAGLKTTLTPYRMALLRRLHFDWQPTGRDAVKWETRMTQLQHYKQQHGNCQVPQHYKDVPGLGEWVLHLRRKYRSGGLSQERIQVLEAVGFQWRLRAPRGSSGAQQQRGAAAEAARNNHENDGNENHGMEDEYPFVHHHVR